MSDGNLKSSDVPTWWWGVGVETWQSFITDITDLTDRALGEPRMDLRDIIAITPNMIGCIFFSLCRLLLL